MLSINTNKCYWKYAVLGSLKLILFPIKLKIWKLKQLSEERIVECEDPQSCLIMPRMWKS